MLLNMIPGSNYAISKNTLNIDQRPHEFKGNLHYQPLTNPSSRYTNLMMLKKRIRFNHIQHQTQSNNIMILNSQITNSTFTQSKFKIRIIEFTISSKPLKPNSGSNCVIYYHVIKLAQHDQTLTRTYRHHKQTSTFEIKLEHHQNLFQVA